MIFIFWLYRACVIAFPGPAGAVIRGAVCSYVRGLCKACARMYAPNADLHSPQCVTAFSHVFQLLSVVGCKQQLQASECVCFCRLCMLYSHTQEALGLHIPKDLLWLNLEFVVAVAYWYRGSVNQGLYNKGMQYLISLCFPQLILFAYLTAGSLPNSQYLSWPKNISVNLIVRFLKALLSIRP